MRADSSRCSERPVVRGDKLRSPSMQRRKLVLGGVLIGLTAALFIGQSKLQAAATMRMVDAPRFEVDPLWPKPLPNHWILGMVIGVGIDSKDHVFIVHRGAAEMHRAETGADSANGREPVAACCRPAPPILEFDPEGNLVKAWGGP